MVFPLNHFARYGVPDTTPLTIHARHVDPGHEPNSRWFVRIPRSALDAKLVDPVCECRPVRSYYRRRPIDHFHVVRVCQFQRNWTTASFLVLLKFFKELESPRNFSTVR